jgi:hypothetical protein
MTTALWVLLTAVLVLLVKKLDFIDVRVGFGGDKKGGEPASPEPDNVPRRVEGGGKEREKLKP